MSKERFAIKIGGAVLSDKRDNGSTIRYKVARRLFGEIARYVADAAEEGKEVELCMSNGTGNYGHPYVQKAMRKRAARGYITMEDISEVLESVRTLNSRLVEYFEAEVGITPEPIPPSLTCQYIGEKDGVKQFDIEALWGIAKTALKRGSPPFTHGDFVVARPPAIGQYRLNEEDNGFEVLSSDVLVTELGLKMKADKIIMVTAEDGVYLNYPPEEEETPIPKIYAHERVAERMKVKRIAEEVPIVDTTGDMKKKLELSQRAAREGAIVQIVNGLVKENLYRALSGDESLGTLILPGKRPEN